MELDELELIRRARAHAMADIPRTTAWRLERTDPSFPRAIRIGPNSYAYVAREWKEWLDSRPRRDVAKAEAVSDEAAESEAA